MTHDLELAAIFHVLKMWRHYFISTRFMMMSDHCGLRCLFDQPNMNANKDRCLATLSEFYFQIRYIKGKEKNVVYAPIRRVKVNHISTVRSYATNLQEWILHGGKHYDKYLYLNHIL